MRIEPVKVIMGVGAGAVDTGLIALDDRQGWATPYKNSREWGRIGLCLIGYLGQALNWFPHPMSALAQSEVTLVTKSVAELIRSRVGAGAMTSRSPVRTLTRGPIRQTARPGFEELRTY